MTDTEEFTPGPKQESYFGTDIRHRYTFPDGATWIEYKTLAEGDRRKYLRSTTKNVRVQKDSGDTLIPLDPGGQRVELLRVAVTDWNLVDGNGDSVKFNNVNFEKFISGVNPKIAEEIEKVIRKENPWLNDQLTVEDIDEQMDQLQELRDELVARDEGKDS